MVVPDLDNQKKIDILLKALDERYKVLHAIRERIQNICLWSLGIFLGAGGWVIQKGTGLSVRERIAFTILITIAFVVVRFFYLHDLVKGFKAQQKVTASIEEKLGLFAKDFLEGVNESIYPPIWMDAGTANGQGHFVRTNYLLLYVGVLLLLLIIWLPG